MPRPITIAGVVYGIKGEYDRAIENYTQAIELNPNYAQAHNNRGAAHSEKGDWGHAIGDYTKAIDLKSDFVEPHYNRGEAQLHLREWEKARVDLINAKNMGLDIIEVFHNDYENVSDFERRSGVKPPEEIAAMLNPHKRES